MPDSITVAVFTHAGGAHMSAYFEALAASPETKEVVLCDADGTFAAPAKAALKDRLAAVYKTPAELFAGHKPAMALVSYEAALAPPVIEACLDAGCHVFAEKPACVKPDQFAALKKKADGKHLHLMLAFANRLNPPILEAQRLIRAGQLGALYGVEMHLVADQTRLKNPAYHKNWFASKARAGGGNLIWLGIHYVDLAMYLTGRSIVEVAGFAGNVGGQPLDVEDSSAVALRFDSGAFGTYTSGFYLDKGYQSHIQIWGSHGWLKMTAHGEPEDRQLRWYSTKDGGDAKVQTYDGPHEPSGYTPFVKAAVRAAAGLQDPPITAQDGLRTLQTVFAFYEAAKTGKTQRIG
jgi:UDP-N-acetyl-2-amino-2-deoxyglucuronate dehydrogenase